MIKKIKVFLIEHSALARFLGSAFLLLLIWVLFTAFFPGAVSQLHYIIIRPQADVTAFFLGIMGYEFEQQYMQYGCEALIIFTDGHGYICVGTGCSGLELFILFFGFILLMRGRLRDKLWFVPLGFLGILVLNIIRIFALSVIFYHHPEYLEFNHKYTFVILVYGAIFGLWVLWVNKFADRK